MINISRIKANAMETYAAMKASAATTGGGEANTNLPFDDRMEFSSSPWVPRLVRGWGQSFDSATGQLGSQKFYFLFNPNQIGVDYGATDAQKDASQDSTAVPGAGQRALITYSFGLMFDRTYEVAYNKDKEGVLRDIEALEKVCRLSASQTFLNSAQVSRWVLGTNVVVYGSVTSIGVKFVNFNKDMIPMRCSIDIVIQQRVVPSADLTQSLAVGGGGGAAGGKKSVAGKGWKPSARAMSYRSPKVTTRRTVKRGGMKYI